MKNNLGTVWPPIDLAQQGTRYNDSSPLARAIGYKLSLVCMSHKQTKGAFSFNRASGPLRTGRSLHLIWRRTMDSRPPFTPNEYVGHAIPDYFGANQWCRTRVSRNGHHSLLITSQESQLAIQFFHYRLPFFPVQLHAVSRVNVVAKSN